MKIFFSTLFIFFTSFSAATAQTGFESVFDSTGSTSWKRINEICNVFDLPYTSADSLYTNGDTAIQGLAYKKIYSTTHGSADMDIDLTTGLLGYLYENDNKDSLWYLAAKTYPPTQPVPILVMTLNLNAGDIFLYKNQEIYTVDSTTVENGRKIIFLGQNCVGFTVKFVEGVGPSMAFPFDRADNAHSDRMNELICTYKNGQHVYTFPTYWNTHAGGIYDCVLNPAVGGGVKEIDGNSIKLSPNPVTNTLSIQSSVAFTGNLQVINSVGTQVFSKKITSENHIIIPFDLHPPGNYFLRLDDGKGNTQYAQFVKQ